ncbi:MAG: hypothetical protein KC505_07440 [Myxococcales bacterium]|nr:hypothetical protein [Myxococcales bacterium]USN51592.1 MAG: hypothetical protein H6731_04055 [Myxococcales bacterium]
MSQITQVYNNSINKKTNQSLEPRSQIKIDRNTNHTDSFEKTSKAQLFRSSSVKEPRLEEKFLSTLDLPSYGIIAKNFIDNYMHFDNQIFSNIDNLLIEPSSPELVGPRIRSAPVAHEQKELEEWHAQHAYKFAEELLNADEKTRIRHQKCEEKGIGFSGNLSAKTLTVKEFAHFAKDDLTIGGRVKKITNNICGLSIYEMLPLYASRKLPKVGLILSELALNTVLTATGGAFAPVSFGISQIITNQLSTVVTLSGDAIIGKILGAENKKIATYAGLRGIQLEIPNIIPGGALIQYYEAGMTLSSGMAIGASSIADIILRNTSDRYASMICDKDLGDVRVLHAMNKRIDYLSKFLIPYGHYLLLRSQNTETKKKLRYILKEQLKVLRKLEKVKSKALNFYQLAILAERLPESHRAEVEAACNAAVPNIHRNTHKVARRCLATLLREKPIANL